MSSNIPYQFFAAVSGNVGEKVPVVDDVLLSHEQEICFTTSVDRSCMDFEFQTDRNYYVDVRQTFLALKLKFVKGCGYEVYITKENKKRSTKKRQKRMKKTRRRRSKRLHFLLLPM